MRNPRYAARKLSEAACIDINEDSACDEKEKDIPAEVDRNFTSQEPWEIFHNTENIEDKMLKGDPNY